MATGSDTRMYSPRSESNLGYSKDDDDYKHGYGDPEEMEQVRDQKQAEKEKPVMSEELPHLQITTPKPEPPMMPPMMNEEEEEPLEMDDQFNEGQQFGAMTGMPDMGNLSLGAATGTMPAPGGMLATGEPMEDAWSSLLKQDPHVHDVGDGSDEDTQRYFDEEVRPEVMNPDTPRPYATMDNGVLDTQVQRMLEGILEYDEEILNEYNYRLVENDLNAQGSAVSDAGFHPTFQDIHRSEPMNDAWSSLMKSKLDEAGRSKDKSWRQPQFEIQPGGARIETATSRRSKQQSRTVSPGKKQGLDRAPLAVHRTHLGVETKQPLRLDAQKYGQQQATQARRKLMGNVPQIPTGHGIGAETDYNPRVPKVGGSGQIKEPQAIREKGKGFAKSIEGIRSDMEEVRKKMNYMQFTQMRRLMRDLKDALERKDKSKKGAVSSGPGEKGKAGHREGQDSTTRNEGATEDLENDPKNWGAPSTLFAAPGSGRVG